MNWYYAQDGQQKGPVSEAELANLVAAQVINDQTLVWHEGMPNWRLYREVRGGAAPVNAVPPVALAEGQVVCSQCGRPQALDQVIQFGNAWVCAQCKPIYLQQMREGVVPTIRRGRRKLPVDPDQLVAEISQRGVRVDVGRCINRGWEVVKANLGISIGTTLLVLICMQAPSIIPFIGACIGLVFNGPLMGGLYLFFLKLIRGEPAEVGDGFAGFKRFGPLAGVFILMMVLIYLPLIPCGAYALATGQFDRNFPDAITIILGVVGFVGIVYLGLSFIFAIPLVMDLELNPWQALQVSRRVVTQKWFSFLLLAIACGVVMLLGFLALCVGMLVAMPVTYAAFMVAYDDNFGEPNSEPGHF